MINDKIRVILEGEDMIRIVDELNSVFDFAWELSQDDRYASYHRIDSQKQVKEYIRSAMSHPLERIIASYDDGVINGLVIYFWKSDEKYAQTTMFLIRNNFSDTANELLNYIMQHLPGYELLIGVPFSNLQANNYFIENHHQCVDSLIDTRISDFKGSFVSVNETVHQITKENFNEYLQFHDKFALPLDMYYTSQKLRNEIDNFLVFIIKRDASICGSIFTKIVGEVAEIYGLFIDQEYRNNSIGLSLLSHTLNELLKMESIPTEIIFFVEEGNPEELETAIKSGFKIVDTYRCYKCLLV